MVAHSLHPTMLPSPRMEIQEDKGEGRAIPVCTSPAAAGLLAALTAAAFLSVALFWPTLGFDFVWDDHNLITDNVQLRSWTGLRQATTSDFFDISNAHAGYGYFRPLVTLSFAMDFLLWRDWAGGYHLSNVILHALTSLLLVHAGARLGIGWLGLLFGSCWFAAHPIHTESVSWIAGRGDVLATLLSLVFLTYWYSERISLRCVASVAIAGALLSKEIALITPVVAWLLYFVFLRNRHVPVSRLFPSVVLVGCYLGWRTAVVGVNTTGATPWSLSESVFSTLNGLSLYSSWLVWPQVQSAYHQVPLVSTLTAPGASLGLGILCFALWAFLVHARSGVFLVAALVALVPVANIIRVTSPMDMGFTMAERFLYMPSVFIALCAAALINLVWSRSRLAGGLTLLTIGCTIVGLGMKTVDRNRVWQSDLTLFEDTYEKVVDAQLVTEQYANALWNDGQYGRVQRLLTSNIQRHVSEGKEPPVLSLLILANSLAAQGETRRGIWFLEHALEENDSWALRYNLGVMATELGELRAGIKHFKAGLNLRNNHVPALLALGVNHLRLGQPRLALRSLAQVTVLDPRNGSGWHALGLGYHLMGSTLQAADALVEAVRLEPRNTTVRTDAALVLAQIAPDRAKVLLAEGMKIQPENERIRAAYRQLSDGGMP